MVETICPFERNEKSPFIIITYFLNKSHNGLLIPGRKEMSSCDNLFFLSFFQVNFTS